MRRYRGRGLLPAGLAVAAALLAGCGVAPEEAADPEPAAAGASAAPPAAAAGASADVAPCPPVTVPQPDGPAAGDAGQPDSALPDLLLDCLGEGPQTSLAALPGPAVITLWASWCGPCRQEMPALDRVARQAASGPEGPVLAVWGVVSEDSPAAAADFARAAGVSFPSLVDQEGALLTSLARPGLPVTVLLRADGTVAHVYSGPALTYDRVLSLVDEHLGVDL